MHARIPFMFWLAQATSVAFRGGARRLGFPNENGVTDKGDPRSQWTGLACPACSAAGVEDNPREDLAIRSCNCRGRKELLDDTFEALALGAADTVSSVVLAEPVGYLGLLFDKARELIELHEGVLTVELLVLGHLLVLGQLQGPLFHTPVLVRMNQMLRAGG